MSSSGRRALTAVTLCLLVRAVAVSITICGQDICRRDQKCCVQAHNASTATCCNQFVDKTYYTIAMVTRKLSGVLIMLLLFALGYSVQRALCSGSRRHLTPAHPEATSREQLMETPDSVAPPAVSIEAQLPSYEDCKRLPTYEETVQDGNWARPVGSNTGQT